MVIALHPPMSQGFSLRSMANDTDSSAFPFIKTNVHYYKDGPDVFK